MKRFLKQLVPLCCAVLLLTGCDIGGSSAGIFVDVNYGGAVEMDTLFVDVTAAGGLWNRNSELIVKGRGFPVSFAIEISSSDEEDLITLASLCVFGQAMNVFVAQDCTSIALLSGEVTDVSLLLQDIPASDSGVLDAGGTDAGPLDAGPDSN